MPASTLGQGQGMAGGLLNAAYLSVCRSHHHAPALLCSCVQDQQAAGGGDDVSSGDMLQNLGTYLTLEKAQVGVA